VKNDCTAKKKDRIRLSKAEILKKQQKFNIDKKNKQLNSK